VNLSASKFSPLLGIFGLFGPALAAIIMAAVTEGKSGVKALLGRVVLWLFMTWIFLHMYGSVLIATLFHGGHQISPRASFWVTSWE
jgi:hypothetical protein